MLTSEYSRALALLEEGSADEAADILSGIVARFPRYAAARIALARAKSASGRPADALTEWGMAESLAYGSAAVRSGIRDTTVQLFSTIAVEHADTSAVADVEDEAAEHKSPSDAPEPVSATDLLVSTPAPTIPMDIEWEHGEVHPASDDLGDDDTVLDAADAAQDWFDAEVESEHAPEWHEDPASSTATGVSERDLPEWETSFMDSGDGSGSDADVDLKSAEDVELDRLIDELESAKIVPRADPDSIPDPDLSSDIDDVVSETLARIYATQKQYGEAARVYERLAIEIPDRASEFNDKAAEMRRNL